MEVINKRFYRKDFLYNNGLINFYMFIKEKNKNKKIFNIKLELSESFLDLKIFDNKVYKEIFYSFLKDFKIIKQTNNKRFYFDEKNNKFVYDYKFMVEGAVNGNDIKNSYIIKSIKDFTISENELKIKYLEANIKENKLPELINNSFIKNKLKIINKKYTEEDKLKIINYLFDNPEIIKLNSKINIYSTLEDLIKNFIDNYFLKNEDKLKIDSKINPFETNIKTLFDMLKPAPDYYKIDKWEALIYIFGSRINKYYAKDKNKKNFSYIILPNSFNLKSLYILKQDLQIINENIKIKNKKDELKEIPTNINFYNQLQKDEIKNNFLDINSSEELNLKFMMFLFSKMYHIEKNYNDIKEIEPFILEGLFDKEVIENYKKLFNALQNISFIIYSYDNNFKYLIEEYDNLSKIMLFFLILKKENLFSYFGYLLSAIKNSKEEKQYNINIKKFAKSILFFQDYKNIVKILYNVSYDMLKLKVKEKNKFIKNLNNKKLYEFLNLYIKIYQGKKMDTTQTKEIHTICKEFGEQLGTFVKNTDNKKLLYKLRNVKNYKHLINFIADLNFEVLKENGKKEKKDYLDNKKILKILNQDENNWEEIKNYIAIYSVNKILYNKTKNEGEK